MKRKDALDKAYIDLCSGQPNDRVYFLQQSKLKEIKSWPFIYWISDEFREKFAGDSADQYMDIVKGLTTSNNERFLRFGGKFHPKRYQKTTLRIIVNGYPM